MSATALKGLYDKLINRAKRLGVHSHIQSLRQTKQKGKFDYHKFIKDCRAVGINPALALSDEYREPAIPFRFGGSYSEIKMIKVLEELLYILKSEELIEETTLKPMAEFYRGLTGNSQAVGQAMAEKVKETYHLSGSVFDFCERHNIHLIYLTEKAPVEGVFLYSDGYLLIAIKLGDVSKMCFTLSHQLGHYFMGHGELDPDRQGYTKSRKKKERHANAFARLITLSDCNSVDVSRYALNELLRARKEELLYTLGEAGSFYRNVKEYVWGV